jgi:VWFA-related protein
MNRKLACLGIIVLLSSLDAISARDEVWQTKPGEDAREKTYKVKTELVEIRAVVTDRKGRIIEDLKREDFELLENDKPQEISFFSVSRVDGKESPPLTVNSAKAKTDEPESVPQQVSALPARTAVVYVDNANLSFSSLSWAKQSLRQFVNERMTLQDMVALVTSSGNLGIAQQFTRDRQMLRYAIEQISYGRPASWESSFTPYLAALVVAGDKYALELAVQIFEAEEGMKDLPPFFSLTKARARMIINEASYQREITLLTFKALVEQMIGLPGQRMIAFISDGFTMHGRDGSLKFDELRSVINLAVRSGVVIYTIDAKGLQPPPLDVSVQPQITQLKLTDTMGYFTASEHEQLDALVALAKDTGGEMYMNTNDLSGALGRAFDANRSYYVLAYYLKPDTDARKFRNIQVRVRKHSEYNVRTARGVAPADTARAQKDEAKTPQQRLIQAINAPLPLTQLNISARADFIGNEMDSRQVLLTVQFEGDALHYRQQDQGRVFGVEILYTIYDTSGKQMDSLSTHVEGTMSSERMAQARTNGYMFSKRLSLKPGAYQVRVGVREEGSDRMGTAADWIEVPDLTRSKFTFSSPIFLDPLPEKDAVKDKIREGELRRIRMVQGVRVYPRDSVCGYFFRLYRGMKAFEGTNLTMKTELLQNIKPVKQGEWQSIPIQKTDIDNKGWTYVGRKLNFAGLKPGIYELSVNVKDSRSGKIIQRSAVFGIE